MQYPPLPLNDCSSAFEVRAFASDGSLLVRSQTYFDPGPDLEVVLAVDEGAVGDEFEVTTATITPYLDGLAPGDLVEDDQHHDISFLAGETGLALEVVAAFAAAYRIAAGTQFPAETLYGAIRAGLPDNLRELAAQRPEVQRAALESAVARRLVSQDVAGSIEWVVASLQNLRVDAVLESAQDGQATIGDLVTAVAPGAGAARRAVTLYLERGGPDDEFWRALAQDPAFAGNDAVPALRSMMRLGELTGNNLGLIRALENAREQMSSPSLRFLAALGEEHWMVYIEAAGGHVPPSVEGATPDERRSTYAALLRDTAEAAFPTAAFTARLQPDDLPSGGDIARFLTDNPDFELGTVPIARYLANNDQALARADDPDAAAASLASLDRLFRLAPRYGQVQPLLAAGIGSAHEIALFGPDEFVASFGDSLGGEEGAATVYASGAHAATGAAAIHANISPAINNLGMAAVPGLTYELDAVPEWKALFGSLDMCACEHCRSVLSPAAYLVDLLHLLGQSKAGGKRTGLDVLTKRRPDLVDIELSCANTNTALPYIDLVNEILEDAVSPLGDPEWWQSRKKADELAIQPEHLNDSAYAILADRPYPWVLPFDLYLERVRRFLAHAGVRRLDVLATYGNRPFPLEVSPPDPLDSRIAAERLGLTPVERGLITGESAEPITALWGGAGVDVLSRVPEFLRRSGLGFVELLELIDTHYINPTGTLEVVPAASCELDKMTIKGLDPPTLGRIYRFVRLWRALGWESLRDLDRALTTLGPAGIDAGFLVTISEVEALRAEIAVPVVEMLGWWGDLDVVDYEATGMPPSPSLFRRLFQNPDLITPLDPAFGALGSTTIEEHAPTVLAGLAITADDLALLTDKRVATHELELSTSEVDGNLLTVAHLSVLHRVASLGRALEMSIVDLLSAKALTGVDPFDGPVATRAFIAAVRRIQASAFSIEELDWLLRHAHRPGSSLEQAVADVDAVLKDLAAALAAIRADTTAPPGPPGPSGELEPFDPAGELTRRMLAIVLAPGQLEQAMALIADLIPPAPSLPAYSARKALLGSKEMTAFLDPTLAEARLLAPEPLPASGTYPPDAQRRSARFSYVLRPLLPCVRRRLSEQAAAKTIGEALGIDVDLTFPMLRDVVHWPRGSTVVSAMDALVDLRADGDLVGPRSLYLRLAKIALVVTRYAMTPAEALWIVTHGPRRGWLELVTLPLALDSSAPSLRARYAGFARLDDLFRLFAARPTLRRVVPGDPAARIPLFELFTGADAAVPGDLSAIDSLRKELINLYRRPSLDADAPALVAVFDLADVESYRNEAASLRLETALAMADRLVVSPATLTAVCAEFVEPKTATEVMQAARAADTGRPSSVIRPVVDALRQRQRDALVAHLLFTQKRGSVNELFDDYLIDVEMSPCQLTSRIKQAIGSVQLFVQRVLSGWEPTVTINDVWARRWRWMRNYRVWEANRKVFLYPENWIEPELRDDKTPPFKEFESALLQEEITSEHVENAFRAYLAQLDEVARLDVRAVCQERRDKLHVHVVARTHDVPHRYFYRRREGSRWTPWEPVEADIQGDHLLLVVYERRLRLLWPVFKEIDYKEPGSTSGAAPYWEISLAQSISEKGVWGPSTTSKTALRFPRTGLPTSHAFTVVAGSSLWIRWFTLGSVSPSVGKWLETGSFQLDSCHGEFQAETLKPDRLAAFRIPKGAGIEGQLLTEVAPESPMLYLTSNGIDGGFDLDPPILAKTPGTKRFELVGPHEDATVEVAEDPFFDPDRRPFFFQDATRTYFVSPGCPPASKIAE